MKLLKVMSAGVVAAALAATMVFSAAATDVNDVLAAAKNAGLSEDTTQYVELKNFLNSNADSFTSEDFDAMIAAANDASATYVKPIADELFPGKALSELTSDELSQIVAKMTPEQKQGIRDSLVKVGKEVGVTVSVDKSDATATVGGDKDNNGGSNVGPADKVDDPVANTGAVGTDSTLAAVMGIITLAAASTGIAVVSKKNRK